MRLRWILIPLGVVAVAAAIVYYLAWVPPQLADDYEKKAEPEHAKVEDALRPAIGEFNNVVLGTLDVDRKDTRAYLRAYLRQAARDKREHSRARRVVRRSRRALARIDEEALTETPSWPLLDGRGDLGEAEALADRESVYLRKARTFLRDFDRLLAYEVQANRWLDRVNLALTRATNKIPRTYTSPVQVTGPLNRGVRLADVAMRALRSLKAPPPVRAYHRRLVAEIKRFVSQHRAISAAYARTDDRRAHAISRQIVRESKKADRQSRKDLTRLVDRSRYRRQIDDLRRRESRIFDAYQDL